jgi:hypothetical protein
MTTVSNRTLEWIKQYYSLVDSGQQDKFMEFFAENAAFRFGNAETIIGRKEIREAIVGLLNSINGIRHDLKKCWEIEGNVVIFECDVTYTRKDNKTVVVHGVVVNVIENDHFTEQRLYVDLTPVFS